MKTIKSFNTPALALLLLLSVGFMSCKKTKTGPAGEKGDTGNANVKSVAFTTTCDWKADSTYNSYVYKFYTDKLDNSVLQRGAIMLYAGSTCGCEWKAMPFKSKGLEYSFSVQLSTVEITVTSVNGKMPVAPGAEQFKVIMIPPAL